MSLTLHLTNGQKVTIAGDDTIEDFVEMKGPFAHHSGTEVTGQWIVAGNRSMIRLDAVVMVEGRFRGE